MKTRCNQPWLAKAPWLVALATFGPRRAHACTSCNTEVGKQVREAVFGHDFMINVVWTVLPFVFFVAACIAVHVAAGKGSLRRLQPAFAQTVSAGLLLGAGFGGFVDGIVFHQILQLHNMFSARLFPNDLVSIDVNMFWDGLFHALCFALVAAGTALLWRARGATTTTRVFVGALVMGAGVFNAAEGTLDHMVLNLHHVVERAAPSAQTTYDVLFVASGVVMLVVGWALCKQR